MKKSLSLLPGILVAFLLVPASAHAQVSETQRLYDEFLQLLQQNVTPDEQSSSQEQGVEINIVEPVPTTTAPQPKAPVKTAQYSVSGKVTRADGGKYLITTDEKPSRILRVYGTKSAKEVMHSVVYEKVQLIGEKAFFNGKEVGISVQQVVPLEVAPVKMVKEAPKPKAEKPVMKHQEKTYTGTIETSQGKAYLVMMENKKRVLYRLLNEKDWKVAFQKAYKGQVTIRGFMTENGAIRYSSIQ